MNIDVKNALNKVLNVCDSIVTSEQSPVVVMIINNATGEVLQVNEIEL